MGQDVLKGEIINGDIYILGRIISVQLDLRTSQWEAIPAWYFKLKQLPMSGEDNEPTTV